jgi:imidazolonepropionase-like amidohydrolase
LQTGAYAAILLVDGDPTKDIMLMADPEKIFQDPHEGRLGL